MSGEKLKRERSETLFFPLTLREDFNTDVRLMRSKYTVPIRGFRTYANIARWLELKENLKFKIYEVTLHQSSLLKKYKLPSTPGFLRLLNEYMLTNGKFKLYNEYGNISCSLEIPNEKDFKKYGGRYIKIHINELATLEEIQNYLKKAWPNIKHHLGIKKERVRPLKHPDLITEIFKLNQLPINDLYEYLKIDKRKTTYTRYELISKILRLKIKGEAVKKLIDRHKK